jgi:hypothetical protein
MAKQTFSSFKELLVKKELSEENSKRDVRFDTLGKIFRFVQEDIILSNTQHFDAEEIQSIKGLLKNDELRNIESKISPKDCEALVKKELQGVQDKTKSLICDLLEDEAKSAQKEHKRLVSLAEKFHPKDPSEELAELNRRIKEIQLDVVDIEMNLMTMENDGKEGSEYFKKAQNARERRKQLIARLEKQVLGVKRKLEKQPKG